MMTKTASLNLMLIVSFKPEVADDALAHPFLGSRVPASKETRGRDHPQKSPEKTTTIIYTLESSTRPRFSTAVQAKPLRHWSMSSTTFVNHPRRHNLQEGRELVKDHDLTTFSIIYVFSSYYTTCVFKLFCFCLLCHNIYKFYSCTIKHAFVNKHRRLQICNWMFVFNVCLQPLLSKF